MQSTDQQSATTVERETGAPERSIVLVVGSGRSGTSVFSGILKRLGFHVPQPEVPADDTNPRGFAESRWVVDFHTKLLKDARVGMADGRPSAWSQTARLSLDEGVRTRLRAWLETQFAEADHLVVKDPRLAWFVSLWRQCAEDLGAAPRFATMLRHPAAVIDSKQRWYGGRPTETGRTAGWLNMTLFTERATREAPRVFVRYDDLLDDWAQTLDRVGAALDLELITNASWTSMLGIEQFLDPSLSRSQSTWDAHQVPLVLREQAEEVWELVSRLADPAVEDEQAILDRLDAARNTYTELYAGAEAIVESSIRAAERGRPSPAKAAKPAPSSAARIVPKGVRRRVPVGWRRSVLRLVRRFGR